MLIQKTWAGILRATNSLKRSRSLQGEVTTGFRQMSEHPYKCCSFPFSFWAERKVELFKLLQLSNIHEVCKEKLLYYSSQQMRGPAVPSDKLAPRVSTASGNEALMFHITDVQQTLQEPEIFFQSL